MTESKIKFTPRQLQDWRDYELVRMKGRYNMYDLRARRATGLSAESYAFVMDHFSELKKAEEGRLKELREQGRANHET